LSFTLDRVPPSPHMPAYGARQPGASPLCLWKFPVKLHGDYPLVPSTLAKLGGPEGNLKKGV
jgi:hypothetical protein